MKTTARIHTVLLSGVFFVGFLAVVPSVMGLQSNTRLTGYDGGQFDLFGISVDISPDGSTALVGASQGTSSVDPGAAYFFSALNPSSGNKVSADDPSPGGDFGHAVALSDDGTTAVIGSPDAKVGENYYQGAVYIFVRSGGWIKQAKLVAPDGKAESFFGCSVDISDNGNTVLIGSCSNAYMNQRVSSVSIFVRQNGEWSLQKGQLRGRDTRAADDFGSAVALSGDGNTALVGARMAPVNYVNDQGAAYVFVRNGTLWSQQEKLTASDGEKYDSFGYAVDLSDDGNTAIIGAEHEGDQVADEWGIHDSANGAAYVFSRSGGNWSEQRKLVAADRGENDRFGRAVALSNNGSIAVIGAEFAQAAYLFTRQERNWNQQEKLRPQSTEAYGFGGAVAVADDGQTVLVGARETDYAGTPSQGVVYVFRPYVPLSGVNLLLLRQGL